MYCYNRNCGNTPPRNINFYRFGSWFKINNVWHQRCSRDCGCYRFNFHCTNTFGSVVHLTYKVWCQFHQHSTYTQLLRSLAGVNFINVLRTAFTLIGSKSAKRHCQLDCLFCAFGICVKAVHRTLMKLSPDPKSTKRHWRLDCLFALLRSASVKVACKHVCEIDLPSVMPI